jgi:hypothetical protein
VEHLPNVSQSKLSFLSVQWEGGALNYDAMMWFSKLTLPNLSSLHLPFLDFEGQWPSDTFKCFLERSKCVLTELVLDRVSLSFPALLSILQSLPHIKLLKIRERLLADHIITSRLVDTMIAGQGLWAL